MKKNINPFIKLLNKQIKFRYKAAGTSKKHKVIDEHGVISDERSMIVYQKKIDTDLFVKVFTADLIEQILPLSHRAMKLFFYILHKIGYDNDTFVLDRKDCMEKCNFKDVSLYEAIKELQDFTVIAETNKKWMYFINPMAMFNGNRQTLLLKYETELDGEDSDV